ncbi:hypothetical protein HU200_013380 [Digitaria exilis]|uniref:DUF4220 domain-containing protein n=1 Tax=Digitaria exilis TaxID=1010633 RepID=A0A835KJP3_9POAL|nr:hypothetical protein HU200_013380 [Digitaria exilis]
MTGGLAAAYIWEQWDIQILVVLSFTLQVILLLSAGTRRREGSPLLRSVIWLAYLLADYTAIYALGHMSISSRSGDHKIMPFWAPFLLLHLGGPDTITAYSFQDNQLWLRHLLTLVVQARHGVHRNPYHGREGGNKLDTEDVLLGAHYMRSCWMGLLADLSVMEKFQFDFARQGVQLNGELYLYELIGMQLSLMYDTLYTKAVVIQTWCGLCIRIISPLSAAAAFLLFQFSRKEAYRRVDIIITYVLLVGALVLELASSLRAAGSSWACATFHARGWHRLFSAVMRIRRLVKAGERRTCLDSIGQYNLLHICTDAKDDLRGKIAKTIGLKGWWQKLHYSSTVPTSDGIKTLVIAEIRRRNIQDLRNARGKWVLKERGMYEHLTRVADETELDRCIVVWHIATDLYLSMCPEEEEEDSGGTIREDISVLSNYMLFLLVVHSYQLPGAVRSVRFKQNYLYFNHLWCGILSSTKEETLSSSRSRIAKKIAEYLLPADKMDMYIYGVGQERYADMSAYVDGYWLAGMLLGNRWRLAISDMLQVIAGVWVEMLCCCAHHCGEESHASKLSTGGEFINAVWLLMEHANKFADWGATNFGGASKHPSLYKKNTIIAYQVVKQFQI